MKKIKLLIAKEWAEVFRNRFVLMAVVFVPLLLTIIPVGILYGVVQSGGAGGFSLAEYSEQFAGICGELSGGDCEQFIIVTQFMPLFLMLPVIIPVTIASYSIVGEKTTRTLEPLLATPITTLELLGGKGLAAVLPAIFATWLSFGLFVVAALVMGVANAVVRQFFNPLWGTAIFVVGPLLSFAAVSFAIMISSRTSDPRVAEQISGLIMLPVVGLLVAQSSGLMLVNDVLVFWMALVLVILDAGLLYFAAALFERETILTRWK